MLVSSSKVIPLRRILFEKWKDVNFIDYISVENELKEEEEKKSEPYGTTSYNAVNILFDAPATLLAPRTRNIPVFTVDKASNGMEGVQRVRRAVEQGRPYAVIFLDMRMPGINGLETAIEIRKYDVKAEIVFITA